MLLAAPLGFKSRCIYIYHKTFVRAIRRSIYDEIHTNDEKAPVWGLEHRHFRLAFEQLLYNLGC